MANLTITNNNVGGPVIGDAEFGDELVTFAGADVLAPGTILARDSVSKKLVIFVKGGVANENGIPKAILTYELTATGAGDLPARVAISGDFVKSRLVIDADGDATNIDGAVVDQLRDYGMIALDTTELSKYDNQ